jgi:hypothetical protein
MRCGVDLVRRIRAWNFGLKWRAYPPRFVAGQRETARFVHDGVGDERWSTRVELDLYSSASRRLG